MILMGLDEFSWIVLLVAFLAVVLLFLEIWVIIAISGFLATYFGFSGVLWWVCAFMMFVFINGIIGMVYNLR